MCISRVYIEGFKRFAKFELQLNPTFNILIGDNETGKSSILEAIGLVLSGQYDGRLLQFGIDPYLFNTAKVADFFAKRQKGEQAPPPRILIEAYLSPSGDDPDMARLRGTNNTKGEDCPGLALAVEVDSDYVDALKEYASDESNPAVLPVEYFKVTWRSFAGDGVTLRKLPFRVSRIDTALSRAYRGANKYLSQVVNDALAEDMRRDLSLQYKKLRYSFSQEPGVKAINDFLEKQGNPATRKKLTIQMDMSSRASWDSAIAPHLDDVPFEYAGMGEQCRVHLRLAVAGAERSQVLLIEEPENHLSHSNLNILLEDVRNDCLNRQVIITTHSGFVLNKLGVDNLRLLSHASKPATLSSLTPDTKNYFMKLPGYDTLRLILSKRCILVEGPSDELIVQRAYRDKYGRLPIEVGVDVISVDALAFNRFLEIAALLNLDVRVVTDNDGDITALRKKYGPYLAHGDSRIRIVFDPDESCPTLEPQLLKANSLDTLNAIFGTNYASEEALLKHMKGNKTDCALKMFETTHNWTTPGYIADAIK